MVPNRDVVDGDGVLQRGLRTGGHCPTKYVWINNNAPKRELVPYWMRISDYRPPMISEWRQLWRCANSRHSSACVCRLHATSRATSVFNDPRPNCLRVRCTLYERKRSSWDPRRRITPPHSCRIHTTENTMLGNHGVIYQTNGEWTDRKVRTVL